MVDCCICSNIYRAFDCRCNTRQTNKEIAVNEWWRGGLRKGDVFMSVSGKEFVFIGWKHGTDPGPDATAMCTAYRGEMFAGVAAVQASNMVKHEDWISGFMISEGT